MAAIGKIGFLSILREIFHRVTSTSRNVNFPIIIGRKTIIRTYALELFIYADQRRIADAETSG